MKGYADRFDFSECTIRGWAWDESAEDNRRTVVTALLDGVPVGSTTPHLVREDLASFTTQPAGYLLRYDAPVRAIDVVAGRLEVRATNDAGEVTTLGLATLAASRLRTQAIDDLLAATPDHPGNRSSWSSEDLASVADGVRAGQVSPLLMPVGLPSKDRSAVIGRRGHLFLTAGSNRLIDLYAEDFYGTPQGLADKTAQWMRVFDGRAKECESRGIRFLQTVLPEKLTVLRDLAPLPVPGPTPLLREVERCAAAREYYVSGTAPFEDWSGPDDPYITTDTHFSAAGAQEVFARLLEPLAPSVAGSVREIGLSSPRVSLGDLSARFYSLPLYAWLMEPDADTVDRLAPKGVTVERREIPDNGHVGSSVTFHNPAAPVQLDVLVFGNSFFHHGDRPHQLTWWAKHFFRRVRVEWNPEFDWDLVDELRPDVVVGQTVERFLDKVPTT